MTPKIEKIKISGLTINARVWGPEDGKRILATHGWLDNAASFDFLAALMPDFRIVSIDFPGHGFSDHLPESGHYEHLSRAIQMLEVVDSLGWEKFSLLGHSLGGIVSMVVAGLFPERVEKLGLIDVIPLLSTEDSVVIDVLRDYYLKSSRKINTHSLYQDLDQAAEVRLKINKRFPMELKSARKLAEGGMEKVEGGYSWTFDQRLLRPFFPTFTRNIFNLMRSRVEMPTCLVLGEQGIVLNYGSADLAREFLKNIEIHELPGTHHLHLDTPEPVAKIFNEFFAD